MKNLRDEEEMGKKHHKTPPITPPTEVGGRLLIASGRSLEEWTMVVESKTRSVTWHTVMLFLKLW